MGSFLLHQLPVACGRGSERGNPPAVAQHAFAAALFERECTSACFLHPVTGCRGPLLQVPPPPTHRHFKYNPASRPTCFRPPSTACAILAEVNLGRGGIPCTGGEETFTCCTSLPLPDGWRIACISVACWSFMVRTRGPWVAYWSRFGVCIGVWTWTGHCLQTVIWGHGQPCADPATHPDQNNFPQGKKKKFTTEARKWRPILDAQTVFGV